MSWPHRLAGILDRRRWAVTTPPAAALGWSFAVRTTDVALGERLARTLSPLTTPGDATWYSIVSSRHLGVPRHRVYRGGERVLDCDDARRVFAHVLWDVNQQAFRRTPDLVLVHAAAAAWRGGGLVLPARSGAGKSTLVAGLVARGLDYLSDEIAAIDPATCELVPFPKAITIRPGARAALATLAPPDADGTRWDVLPDAIRPGAAGGRVPVRWIIVPAYVEGATTELVEIPRAEALGAAAHEAFRATFDRHHFATLARVVRGARCARLVSGDLDAACDAVLAMLTTEPA